ncbi:septin-5 isoform X2 [Strongylocentrotus purpuratus]|uniref:Septin-type G domain-containing protein n=1 Tax=Strongylocentrotus purpuratus TaxID=7668 RepID=A0A7M7MYU2_STRPU|nr:septin-5 isoform X2 [Strongylocentrotus purpuratus]
MTERIDKTAEIQRSSIDIEEQGVRLRLTVVDTPGFGDSVNSENSWGPIISHIESKFEQYYRDESGLNRKNLIDDRVHCCLYFISPYGHGLRPIDIEFMKRLHDKVNIVPIIAKADCLTKTEVKRMKDRVLREISEHEIGIYAFPDCESDEDEDFKKQDQELKASIPFAVIGSNTVVEVNGRRVRGRLYPWGITEVENPKHCDFVKLRNMLIRTHMQDLKDVTRDVHYENYRLGRIRGGGTQLHRERSKLKRDSGVFDEVAEKDRMLEQKEVELRQMQVMLEKMQREMAVTQRNSRGDNLQYDDRRSSTVEV